MLVTATLRGAGDVTGGGEQLEVCSLRVCVGGGKTLEVVALSLMNLLLWRYWTFRVEIISDFRGDMSLGEDYMFLETVDLP